MNENDADVRREYRHPQFGRFRVDRVVGYYDVSTYEQLPFGCWTLKVLDMGGGEFQAVPNVHVFNSVTQCIEHSCGIGKSVDEAIRSAIDIFMSEVEKQKANKPLHDLNESDFVWLGWQPYVQLSMPNTWRKNHKTE